jgi:hypothetical protein
MAMDSSAAFITERTFDGHECGMNRFVLVLLLPACGSSVPFASDDVALFDGGPVLDSTVPTFDASIDVAPDSPKFGGGGPFLCQSCVCDGTLNYCAYISGGKMPLLDAGSSDASDDAPFGDASACDTSEAGASACTAIPIDCLPNPSCACVLAHGNPSCTCAIDPSGNGLVVTCVYP